MALGDRDDPLCNCTQRFGLLYSAPLFFQVTADCDHVPILMALSTLQWASGPESSRYFACRDMMELFFARWSRDGRGAEMALLAAKCPL
jgi:hypothetical protein